ncbi:MAG: tetratricopeptide repeat protein [Chloroflexi bacterium]|nr:tetratricopeptide repeat protein [Chloroflexota bacterium]
MDDARELRQQGIRAAKAGQREEARTLLQQSLRLEPENEAAWLWLASVANNNRERVFCLNKVLELNPINETALRALENLNEPPLTPQAPARSAAPAAPTPGTKIDELTSQQPGIPIPTPDRIAGIQGELEKVARSYSRPIPKRTNWSHKTRGRAGERDIIAYRLQVLAAALVVLILLVIGFFIALQTNSDLQYVVYGPSPTATLTPTVTPTFTPGFTATPSATPRVSPTPSATVALNIPAASPPALPRATEVYPEVLDRFVANSIQLLDQGEVPQALATLDREREQNFDTTFNANIYYYYAIGLARDGSFNTALEALQEADERLGERPENIAQFRPFLDSAYAQVYALQAQRAEENGNIAGQNEALALMREKAELAVEGDARLAEPYLLLADAELRSRRFADAVEILNQGLNVTELAGNTRLLMAKARVYYEQRSFDAALYQIFLVHYIDPSIEEGYELKVQISLDRNRPGDAVLAAQDYLFYYPGSTRAFRLLADAYREEDKIDLALSIYNRGLTGRTTDADTVAMLASRAQIYRDLGETQASIDDYSRAFEISNDVDYRLLRMEVAVEGGRFTEALADAEVLAREPQVPQGMVSLVRGRALVESASPGDRTLHQEAQTVLEQALAAPEIASSPLRGVALEFLARAQLELGATVDAADTIESALDVGETGSRRYWRGRINEARNRDDEAIVDYEFVLAWSRVYPYPFRGDVEERLLALRS